MKNEDAVTTNVEMQTRRIPSIGFLGVAIGCMAASALLMISGRKTWANFVGQWAPTILILGTYNKIAKTFSAPIDEEQRIQHGGHPSLLKSPEELTRQMSPQPVS
ncbi:hypothetical protein ATI61_104124 [Archangium gephyra]|uniref:Uncharacterized protein n=1 Tax=Archangium gephyra TaxID=48 RepID=A0AAC8Q3K5_9BACT|nr:hypothetical protein [Archangium gephyra]AKJ00469.1 Hypothetical protein AA314_02095 [Archangium gephyra]REG32834.1 hypothetical protein ATI61_104124 [Archangium gephyra]